MFETANAGFAQAVYEEFLRNPEGVSPEWRRLFESGVVGETPVAAPAAEPPAAAGNGTSPAAPAPAPADAPPPPNAVPLKGPAARLVANMNESLSVPTATTFRELPVASLEAHRARLNAALATAGRSEKISFTHLIGFAIVQAAKLHPSMLDVLAMHEGVPHRVTPTSTGLGIAVDMERKDGTRGLVVPVIKAADTMDFATFHATYESLIEKARTSRLMPDDFSGGTIQLTNPGGLGTVASVPRLMAGQGTIVAVGAISYPPEFSTVSPERVRELGISKVMTITSTYDHRVIQGAESGTFLRTIERFLSGTEPFYEAIAESLHLPAATGIPATSVAPAARAVTEPSGATADDLARVAAAMALVKAFRMHGHLAARLDPLGSEPIGDPALDPDTLGLTPEVQARVPARVLRIAVPGDTLAEALPRLRETYCGTIAYEVEHISDHAERVWLRNAIESGTFRRPLPAEERRALLGRLTAVETFERFLHKAYLGQKRFSVEGVDALVPMLDLANELAGEQGAREVTIGMAHRGRLNVLVHTVGRPYESIMSEFEGHKARPDEPDAGTGDVKYHLGAEGTIRSSAGKTLTVSVLPNPSHLEFVGPVVNGRIRARQTSRKGRTIEHDPTAALPIVIHGDAAFAGQGVVAETLNLANLAGYDPGGTLHIITNNQIGFTTDMRDSRSTRYASDLAKGFDVAIIHVNADDPEACLSAVRLAMAYRAKFRSDVLIDLVGYRRWGHNEGDEPAYTQPVMYERIKELPTVRAKYAARLVADGLLSAEAAEAEAAAAYQRLVDVQQAMKTAPASRSDAPPDGRRDAGLVETALPAEFLTTLNEELLAWPAGFTVHPKLARQLERRRKDITAPGGIDWGHAEALAMGSLLLEGVPIRLTGQDTERGTFSHRHFVLHDVKTGDTYAPISRLTGAQAPIEIHNSPLSELATMGFEYGYSVAAPEALVLWEAQFGDFVNGAQVFLDQFLAAGLSKWGQRTRLTLLLPHGYEGQGPEHSSARLERFLQSCAERNMRVANCSTPAQYFHLLRQQAHHAQIRPLVVMTPKSLLRLPAAASSLTDLSDDTFRPVLDDPARPTGAARAVLCSGKLYYELAAGAAEATPRPAIIRQELLYPYPADELRSVLGGYPGLREVVWAQEEPENMGAWNFVQERLRALLPEGVTLRYAGRPNRASPAEGYPSAHAAEQARIVGEAVGG
ncbi:MAG TPA: multifunctional oxoglutarate decarboxylase/oxoglutarate dehydrogenase thiamine pyrophosphate-binding subunit/dihydrolipoyllysine-residue succinyltransferase subunit [Gemmatimonadales bacterium]|nr:multifunctional oxoglutarate decarboxylase/oxoglutarate dehydrogenase thiamine pyrophosphate-binding subunit/dihydrolipoyllysine-residue succinyltransferase subunit [Gemmatimonadales bacterium]